MRDVVMLALIVAFFALCAAYIWWCDRIIGPDVDNAVDTGADDATVANAGRGGAGIMIAAAADNWIGLGLSLLVTVYLVFVLVKPEKF